MNFLKLYLPELLKKHWSRQFLKKDNPEDAKKYASISITGALSKVFEKFKQKEINEYLQSNNLLKLIQFGLWTSNSTIDAILYFTEFFRVKITTTNT